MSGGIRSALSTPRALPTAAKTGRSVANKKQVKSKKEISFNFNSNLILEGPGNIRANSLDIASGIKRNT